MSISKRECGWLFGGLGIDPLSKLGMLLVISKNRVSEEEPGLEKEILRVRVVEKLNKTVGCDIQPRVFLALGTAYLATEPGMRAARQLNKYFDDRLETDLQTAKGRGSTV